MLLHTRLNWSRRLPGFLSMPDADGSWRCLEWMKYPNIGDTRSDAESSPPKPMVLKKSTW
jgi:hypothetical protein